MMASRGMGAIAPGKMPKGVRKSRRDDTDFTEYAEGGKVNAAGNYTKPSLRKRIVSLVKALSQCPINHAKAIKVSIQRIAHLAYSEMRSIDCIHTPIAFFCY